MKNIKFWIKYQYNKARANVLYKLCRLRHPSKPKKGDEVECFGIGYPHWKAQRFIILVMFDNGDLLINRAVRVSQKDFKVVNQTIVIN